MKFVRKQLNKEGFNKNSEDDSEILIKKKKSISLFFLILPFYCMEFI